MQSHLKLYRIIGFLILARNQKGQIMNTAKWHCAIDKHRESQPLGENTV